MSKVPVSNISATGIIYRAGNPAQIFIEVKDDGHPIKLVRRQLCPIGGNWIGEGAKNDGNTLDTFVRELKEELSFDRPIRDSVELNLMGYADVAEFAPVPKPDAEVTPSDMDQLVYLKSAMVSAACPFGDFLNTVTREALDSADPTNKRDGFTTLSSYRIIGLAESEWKILVRLQEKFKNLSNESITLITSLDEIIRTGTKTSFAHDRVLKQFFLDHGLKEAENLPLVPGLQSVPMGMPLATYANYLERYDVAKKPV